MRLYRTAKGRWVGTQEDARKDGKGWEAVDVPTVKEPLIAFLNDNTPAAQPEKASPAYKQGRSDAQRGITANPYGLPYEREEWERGHAEAFELGVAPRPSFRVITRGRTKNRRAA
jgi:hypothetical protein